MKRRKAIYIMTGLAFVGIIAISIGQIAQQLHTYSIGANSYTELRSYVKLPKNSEKCSPLDSESPSGMEMVNTEPGDCWPEVDFPALCEINPDTVGWIYIEGTEIDYPVVQGEDNQYYLRHLFDGEWNSSGCIFLDNRNTADFSDRHSILYGHHMENGTMFAALMEYKEQEYYDSHPTVLLATPEKRFKLDLFAGYVANVEDEAWKTEFSSDQDFDSWIESSRNRSCFISEINPACTDRIVTLSTCSYEFENARFVLLGRVHT